jgi:Uncharacterised protein family (UPF0175)
MSVKIEIDDELAAILGKSKQPLETAAKEMIVLELYRQRVISSGKAAKILGRTKIAFIQYASSLGIDYYTMTEEEWEAEKRSLWSTK